MVVFIPAPEKQKQQDNCEFKASQGYVAQLCLKRKRNQMIGMGTPEFWFFFFNPLNNIVWEEGLRL